MRDRALYEKFIDYLVVEKRRLDQTVSTYGDEMRRFFEYCDAHGLQPAACEPIELQNYLLHRDAEHVRAAEAAAARKQAVSVVKPEAQSPQASHQSQTKKIPHKLPNKIPNKLPNKFLRKNSSPSLRVATLRKIISTLNTFYEFCVLERVATANPMEYLKAPRAVRHEPSVLSEAQITGMLEAIDTSTALGLRDRALFELMYACALRISEAVSLDASNLLSDEGLVRVRGKGDKERIVPLGSHAKAWLERYLAEARPQLAAGSGAGAAKENALFLNFRGKRLSRKGIWKNYKKILGALNIDAPVHALRHSCATHLLAGGMDVRTVQELLGHADLSTTQLYTHLADDTLEKAHAQYHPRQ